MKPKVILYMAMSVNGMIASENDDTSWISKVEWDCYSLMIRTAGNVIIGHRTYEILTKQPEFSEFKEVKVVVVAHASFNTLAHNHFIVQSPAEAIAFLNDFNEIIIAGGSKLNTSFLQQKFVDEIFLDIEPILLGNGIPFLQDTISVGSLKLLGQKLISPNEIQLHYAVEK